MMASKNHNIVGVDIGSHSIKICQLKGTGKDLKLIALGSANIKFGAVEDGVLQDPDEVSRVIVNLFKNLKIKSKKIGISISGYSVIVKKISLEKMDDNALDEYIRSEAEQYIPFDINDVYIDYQKILQKKDSDTKVDVMIVAAKKEVVNDYLSMLHNIKLQTVLVDVDGFALENIWENVSTDQENTVLVDIGASKMNINIISGGVSVLARDIMVGSVQLTDQLASSLNIDYSSAEKIKLGLMTKNNEIEKIQNIFNNTCTQWVLEIKKAVDMYRSNYPDEPLSSVVLSGGGAKVNGLVEFIQQEINLKVYLFNPFKTIIFDKNKIDRQYIDLIAPEMAIAAGIAIRQSPF